MTIHLKRTIYKHLYETMTQNRQAWQPSGLVGSETEAYGRAYDEIAGELRQRATGTRFKASNAKKKKLPPTGRVRILESAFPGSDEPEDVASRGQTGSARALDYLGKAWAGCWEVLLDDGGRGVQVTTEEIEFIREEPR